jgi:adenosylmethionine---8-amino-7-oxononanoate aminotransferase
MNVTNARGTIWHPCTQMKDHETYPPIRIARGNGIYLYDDAGNSYIDAISSWWVNLFGHANERIIGAICAQGKQLEQVIFAGFTHGPAEELAERLLEIGPAGLEHVFFTDNGSAAVEAALKMSHGYHRNTGRPEKGRFVYLDHGYHGETLGALAVCGEQLYKEMYAPIMTEQIRVEGPDCFRCPHGRSRETCAVECFGPMERTLVERGHEIAAVIVEPMVQCAGGFRIYPAEYLRRLREATTRHGVLLILDEIAVGFGRTGPMLAGEHAGITADLVCLSKGITSGTLPLSVVLSSHEIFQAFYHDYTELKAFLHSHSYTGNALACAAAVETMRIFRDEDVLQRNVPKYTLLQRLVRERFGQEAHVGEIRGLGFICAVELVRDRAAKEPFDWRERTGMRIYREALKRGALLRNLGDIIYFMPPYVITEGEIERLVDIAHCSMKAVLP